MQPLDEHRRELKRLATFMVGFAVLAGGSYLVPGTELVRPWMPGEPVPLAHLLLGERHVVEVQPGVLVSVETTQSSGPAGASAGIPLEDTGDPDDMMAMTIAQDGAVADEGVAGADADPDEAFGPMAPPSDADAHGDADPDDAAAVAVMEEAPAEDALADPTTNAAPQRDALAAADPADDSADDATMASAGALDATDSDGADDDDDDDDAVADAIAPDDLTAPKTSPAAAPEETPAVRTASVKGYPARYPAQPTPLTVPDGALDHWFSSLALAEAGVPGHVARALHWGDSTIAGDGITRTVRGRMQARFGDGGPGFLAAEVDPRWSSRPGIGRTPSGDWKTRTITHGGASSPYYGLAGTVSTAQPGASSTLAGRKIDGERQQLQRVDVFFQAQPGGGTLVVNAGEESVAFNTAGEQAYDRFHRMDVPAGAQTVRVSATGDGPVTVYGVALETSGPGVTWESLGVAGASGGSIMRQAKGHMARQVAWRDPDLIVYQMGGNEMGYPALKASGGKPYKDRMKKIVAKIRAGAPDASCLIVTPLDQAERYRGTVRSKEMMSRMVSVQREAALEMGCAFWDAQAAMGGEGSFGRWMQADPPLAWSDLYHLTNRGLRLVGHTLSDAMLASYDEWRGEHPGPVAKADTGNP